MNKADVISKASAQTGVAPAICNDILTAFEAEAGGSLLGEFLGTKAEHAIW